MNRSEPHFKWVILGHSGQLGGALTRLLQKVRTDDQVIPLSRKEADLSQPERCIKLLEKIQPSIIINASAYTQVDLAETERELALQINAKTPGIIAFWCAQHHIPFIHFSSDYVFSGEGDQAWKEADATGPLNHYGHSKAIGEQNIIHAGGQFLIFRTSWVYDSTGKNFLNTMLLLGKNRETLRIVGDQIGSPTFATDLALVSYQCIVTAMGMKIFPSGIYHAVNQGETTWYEFAKKIFEIAQKHQYPLKTKRLIPIKSREFPTPAVRPKNSRLNTSKLLKVFNTQLPPWEDGLKRCLEETFHEDHSNSY
jgi:dTDP-4-dehydrorhamnose reductase